MNEEEQKQADDFLKMIESMDFSSEKDLEFLTKLNETIEAVTDYAHMLNEKSKQPAN